MQSRCSHDVAAMQTRCSAMPVFFQFSIYPLSPPWPKKIFNWILIFILTNICILYLFGRFGCFGEVVDKQSARMDSTQWQNSWSHADIGTAEFKIFWIFGFCLFWPSEMKRTLPKMFPIVFGVFLDPGEAEKLRVSEENITFDIWKSMIFGCFEQFWRLLTNLRD